MAKTHRGKNIRKESWRGTCPSCERKAVKLLWSKVDEEKGTLNVCKICGT